MTFFFVEERHNHTREVILEGKKAQSLLVVFLRKAKR